MSSVIDDYFAQILKIPLLTAAEEIHLGQLIRAWQDHEGGPNAAPAQIARRGRKALNRFITGNLRLVINLASKYRSKGIHAGLEFEDLLSEGNIGLARAAVKFDPAMGYKFSTYAYWWIRQGISRAIECGGLIRFSVHIKQMIGRLKRQQSLNPSASFDEIAIAAGFTPKQAKEALEFDHLQNVASFDAPAGKEFEGYSALLDTLVSPQTDVLEAVQYQDLFAKIREELADELALIELKEDNNNTQDLSHLLGISRQKTRTELDNARMKLQKAFTLNGARELLAA